MYEILRYISLKFFSEFCILLNQNSAEFFFCPHLSHGYFFTNLQWLLRVSRDPFNKGKLIIIFNINYPERLDPTAATKIAALLPKVNAPAVPSDAELVKLEVFDGKKYKWKNLFFKRMRF